MKCCVAGLALLLLLAGCSTVSTTSPLGNPLPAEEAKKYEGVWLTADGDPCYVKHTEGNRLRVAFVEWNEGGDFELVKTTAYATEEEELRYVNVEPGEDGEESAGLNFLRIVATEGDYLILAPPNAETFDAAIKAGKLSGTSEKTQAGLSVKIDSPSEALNAFVDPAREAEQFYLSEPTVLHRVQQPEEDEKESAP